jgi:hypothetical protein
VRERVFGIESEYALIYHPGRGDRERPTNLTLYRRFEAALRGRVRSLPNALSPFRAKVGRFLENGGTFHYEANADYEHGLIEMASPECRDPYTLLRYERAKDELLEELCEDVNRDLELAGYTGRVRIGKNNVDSAGNTFGSHENYWVEDRLPLAERALFGALWVLLWIPSLPVLGFVLGVQVLLLLGFLVATLLLLLVALMLAAARPEAAARLQRWMQVQSQRLETRPGELVRALQKLVAPLYPLVALHSAVYNRFQFRRLRGALTAFLVTRTLTSGAGRVVLDGGPIFRLAQRPPFLRALSRIFLDGNERPVYETRELFFRPWSALRSKRRLHLLLGDANLCEWAQLLRVGTTALVLEAIETDRAYHWPRLRDPLRALAIVNRDPELAAKLELTDGTEAGAIEIQRRYLEGVRRVLAGSMPLSIWKARVLRAWEETLDGLERDPDSLADRLDWVAKRRTVLALLPDARDRDALERRGAELVRGEAPRSDEEARLRDLAFAVLRADLRYHELSPRGGFRRLEARERVRRITDPESVRRARHEPPADTRAHARGRAIQWAHQNALSGGAAWHRVRIGKFGWRFFLDPLDPGR